MPNMRGLSSAWGRHDGPTMLAMLAVLAVLAVLFVRFSGV